MKKLSATSKRHGLNASSVSRCLSVSAKLSFGTAMIALLSSVSPVLAANLAITGANNMSQNLPGVNYSKGSHGSIVFSGDDDYCGVDHVMGRGSTGGRTVTAITVEEEYRRFLEQVKFNGFSPYSQSSKSLKWTGDGKTDGNIGYMGKDSTGGDTNIMPEAYGIYSFATGCGSSAQGNYSVAFGANATAVTGGAQAFGVAALASGKVTVAIGVGAEASGDAAVALGGLATASGERSIAIGTRSIAQGEESIAIGSGTEGGENNNSALAMGIQAIAIGSNAMGLQNYSVVVGASAVVSVSKGIALGYGSVANVGDGILGYDPTGDTPSKDKSAAWKSSVGSLSIGNPEENITRQITGVAAGTADTDAVNVAQLKALRGMITQQEGWDLVVDGAEKTTIGSGDTLVLAAGSKNFEITKDKDDKKVKFDLAKDITLDSVKTGENIFDKTGLIIKDGPSITTSGISAGNKKITGVKEGTEKTDAVNFAQLEEVKKQLEGSGLVVQDEQTQHITIGKDTGGDKIDIANKDKENRTLTGVKNGALSKDSNEAVTGSQLFETNNDVVTLKSNFSEIQTSVEGVKTNLSTIAANTSQYLGGGADILNSKAPTYTIEDKSYNDVASAFAGVSGSFIEVKQQITDVSNSVTNVENQIKNVVNNSLVKQDAETQDIIIGKGAGGDKIDITNNKNQQRTLTGIKNGDISKDSKEAVTGSQLFETNKNVATYLGGGADYKNGKWTAPSFKVNIVKDDGQEKSETYQNVADALAGVGTSFTNVQNKITKEITDQINNAITNVQGDSLVKKDSKTNNITIGREVEGTEIDITNSKSELRTLSGVKEATKANEAINKGQFDKGVKKLTEDLQFENSFAVHYDKKSNDNGIEPDYTNITLGKGQDASPVFLHNVANGTIGKDSHDAINGGQINTIGEDIAKFLGGGTEFVNGAFKGPKYSLSVIVKNGLVAKAYYNNVGDALTRLNSNIRNVNQLIKDITQSVTQDSLFWSAADEAFSAQHGKGNKKAKSKITHLLDGNISKDSTDAITGGQLYLMSNTLATYLGGGAKYENGTWIAPTFKLTTVNGEGKEEEKTYPDVAKALEGVGSSITNVQNKVTEHVNNVVNKLESDSLVQQDKATNHITIGTKIEGSVINIANKNGEDRTISGVKAATQENEAINKGQFDTSIKDVNNKITNKFNELNQNITNITQQVKGDSLLWNSEKEAFVAQHGEEKTNSKITFLANGVITADSTDAINGSQLYSMGNSLAAYLGGGAEYNEGNWTAPTFTFKTVQEDGEEKDETYQNVAEALSGVGKSFRNIQNKLTNEINNTKDDALLWSESDKAFVAQHGEEKTNSKISFLANGDITQNSMDAINGSQLYSMINSLSGYFGGGAGYQNGEWKDPTFYVSQFKNDGSSNDKTGYHDVSGAFEGVNDSMKNINERINNVAKDISSSGLNWNETEKAFDARHDNQDSKITHVADGKVSEDSKEAVNGSQLWETNKKVEAVEERVDTIDQHVKDIENTVTNDAVKYDKGADGKKTNKVTLVGGNESDPVLIDNVAAGELSKDSKEAVNGSQLWEMNQQMKTVLDDAKKYTDERFNDIINSQMGDVINEAKSYTDMKFEGLKYELKEVRKESRQAAAIGLAVSNLSYEDTPGSLSLSIGTGVWRSQSAFAIGAGYMSENGKIRSNISAASSGGHWGIGAGLRVKLN